MVRTEVAMRLDITRQVGKVASAWLPSPRNAGSFYRKAPGVLWILTVYVMDKSSVLIHWHGHTAGKARADGLL